MIVQQARERESGCAVLPHPDWQRLGASKYQPRVKGTQDRPGRVLYELQPLDVLVAGRDDDTADAVAMSVQIFRGAVCDEVGPEFDRSLDIRTRKRVIDHELGVVMVCEI